MAKIEKLLCPNCIFSARYIDLILNEEGIYICPQCNAQFSYDEIMHLYSMSQYTFDIDKSSPKTDLR